MKDGANSGLKKKKKDGANTFTSYKITKFLREVYILGKPVAHWR